MELFTTYQPSVRLLVEAKTKLDSKVNYISAKAFKRAIRNRRIEEDAVFLGLIQKGQEPTEQVEDMAKK